MQGQYQVGKTVTFSILPTPEFNPNPSLDLGFAVRNVTPGKLCPYSRL